MSQMLKSSGAMAAATMTSRILGMVREIVYARFMGDTWVAGAFQFAFAIPNLFRRLLGEGALTAAFIPIFKEKEQRETAAEMWRAVNAVISGLLLSASALTAVVMLAISAALALWPHDREGLSPFAASNIKDVRALATRLAGHLDGVSQLVWSQLTPEARELVAGYDGSKKAKQELQGILAKDFESLASGALLYEPTRFAGMTLSPGTRKLLAEHPQGGQLIRLNRLLLEDAYNLEISDKLVESELMLRLLRVMFPYMLVICLTAIFMGILNARGHFFIPAAGAVIMNVVMIASVLLLAPRMGRTLPEQIFALAIGVLVAGVAQALFQLPALRAEGFRHQWVSPWRDPTVSRVVRQMIPGAIGVAAFQLNVVLTQGVAAWVDLSINASFQYAVRLMELPQGVFGLSLATYLLPTLSGMAAEKKHDDFRATLNKGLDHIIFINLLAAMLLLVLAGPILRLLFERGAFGPDASRRAAFALICLSPRLLAVSVSNILARAFYALGDTKTPMKISIFCLGINMALAVLLVNGLRQGGLGIANSVSAICNASILFYTLQRKLGGLELAKPRKILPAMAVAIVIAGLAAWGLDRWWEQAVGHGNLERRLGGVFVPMTVASLIYWGIALALKVAPATEIGALIFRRGRRMSAKSWKKAGDGGELPRRCRRKSELVSHGGHELDIVVLPARGGGVVIGVLNVRAQAQLG